MVVTFFGHSDYVGNLEDEEYLFNLIKEVGKYRDIDFYLGGYGGFDNFAFRCAKKYKESAFNYCICAFFIVILQPNVKFRDLCTKEYS